MGRSFQAPGTAAGGTSGGYMVYFFPGTVVMILLFTSIFSTISLIEDRREGFLQSVLVAPISRLSIVAGKVLGGTILAVSQGVLFLLTAPLMGFSLSLEAVIFVGLALTLVSFTMTAL